jgi:hypothetical protein
VKGLLGIAAAPDFTDWGYSAEEKEALVRDGKLERPNPYGPEPSITWRNFGNRAPSIVCSTIRSTSSYRSPGCMANRTEAVPMGVPIKLMADLRSSDVQLRLIKNGGHRLSEPHEIHAILVELHGLRGANRMIFFLAALHSRGTGPSSTCPTVLTHEAQACRAIEASKAGRFADAATAFESAADLTSATDPARDRALAAAGNMWIAAGQPGKAAVALDKALAGTGLKAAQHGLALLDRARAAEAQGDLKTARTKIDEAAKTIGEDPFLWYFSAALSLREENVPAAKSAINRASPWLPIRLKFCSRRVTSPRLPAKMRRPATIGPGALRPIPMARPARPRVPRSQ